jgi:hypothetical protein
VILTRGAHHGAVETDAIEREIAGLAARANLHLRFDRVALRVIGLLRKHAEGCVPEGEAVLLTVTAPIRHPTKTAGAVAGLLRQGLSNEEVRAAIHGNDVRLRRVSGVGAPMPRLLGFVHNPGADAGLILDLAEARLRAMAAQS